MPSVSMRGIAWGGFALLLGVAPQVFTSSLAHSLLSQIGIAAIACLSYNLLFGQGGMLSFGHAAHTGLGAFLAIHTLNLVGRGELPLPVSLVPVAGGLAALAFALALGWVTTRRGGTPFAMITLGIGELLWAAALMFPGFFGGEAGVSGNRVAGGRPWGISLGPQVQVYYLIAAYTFACTALMYGFTRTPLGRLLNAVRDNPDRVACIGFDPHVVRYLAFAIAAFFAGVAGGLAALNFEIVTAEVLGAQRSGVYLLFTFLGGSTLFFGPLVGAVLMVLATVLLSELTRAWLLYLGLAFVLMVMHAPGGLAGLAMAQLHLAREARWRALAPAYLGLAAAAAVALAGGGALVEMVYHRRLDDALGPDVRFLGVALDTSGPDAWVGALLLLATGGGLFELARRPFQAQWRRVRHGHEEATP